MDRKDSYTEVFLKAAGVEADVKKTKDFKAIWWYSTRDKDIGGLRMTDHCLEFVETKSEIKTYKIEIPKEMTISPQVLIWLDQYIDTPWHITKKHIVVLSERTAFELYMFSGDVKKLGMARTMAKRLRQESPPN
jgi:hypothetical protein